MNIHSVEFAGAIGQVDQAAPSSVAGLPQVAFSGRSNVGKSSLINRVLGRTRTPVARVSQQPGKTQEINFYRVTTDAGEFCLVDLPGYGYAKVPEALRKRWRPLIEAFLRDSPDLVGVVQLVDLRHGPTDDDLRAIDFLAELRLPMLTVLTKLDKLKASQRDAQIRTVTEQLRLDADQVLAVSAVDGTGRDDLLDTLESLLFPAPPDET